MCWMGPEREGVSGNVSVNSLGNDTINNLNCHWLAFGHKELIILSAVLYKKHWRLEATRAEIFGL